MDAYFNQQHDKRNVKTVYVRVRSQKGSNQALFKTIFTLVRGNDWKAGAYGNMDVDKPDEMDDKHPSTDLHVLSPWDMSRTTAGCFLRETFITDMLRNCGIFSIVNDMFEAKR